MKNNAAYRAYEKLEKGYDVVVARIVDSARSSPRHNGATMAFVADGRNWGTVGGGLLEAKTTEECMKTFKTKEKSHLCHFNLDGLDTEALDMACGGEVDILIEYYSADNPNALKLPMQLEETALIFGAGHVGLALDPVLRYIGFNIIVLDDREEFANHDRFPHAKDVVVIDSYEDGFRTITTDKNTYIIIVTRGHKGDYAILKSALKQNHAYIGMIGSHKKTATIFDMLRRDGVSEDALQTVYAPIGERIFAETPEEIAISIAAQMIRVRSGHGNRL